MGQHGIVGLGSGGRHAGRGRDRHCLAPFCVSAFTQLAAVLIDWRELLCMHPPFSHLEGFFQSPGPCAVPPAGRPGDSNSRDAICCGCSSLACSLAHSNTTQCGTQSSLPCTWAAGGSFDSSFLLSLSPFAAVVALLQPRSFCWRRACFCHPPHGILT